MLVSLAVLAIILAIIFEITQQVSTTWKNTESKISAFQSARGAFETMTQTLRQATLNTYYDYQYDSTGKPAYYYRNSDLEFISGQSATILAGVGGVVPITHVIFFQTPQSSSNTSAYQDMHNLMNACGFYLTWGQDQNRPSFLSSLLPASDNPYRYRLMMLAQPTEQFSVYQQVANAKSGGSSSTGWFTGPLAATTPPIEELGENIVALVFLPVTASSADVQPAPLDPNGVDTYAYDSFYKPAASSVQQPATANQLPPAVEIVMVAVDERSMAQYETSSSPPDFGQLNHGSATLFTLPSLLESDLLTLENNLAAKKLNFHVFRTTVPILGSKWGGS